MSVVDEPMPPLPSKAGYETDDPVGGIDSYEGTVLVDAVRQVRWDIADDLQF
ncbi:hypothetical protein ACFIOY_00185 [Bradyrhizobium sp. TZ2]